VVNMKNRAGGFTFFLFKKNTSEIKKSTIILVNLWIQTRKVFAR